VSFQIQEDQNIIHFSIIMMEILILKIVFFYFFFISLFLFISGLFNDISGGNTIFYYFTADYYSSFGGKYSNCTFQNIGCSVLFQGSSNKGSFNITNCFFENISSYSDYYSSYGVIDYKMTSQYNGDYSFTGNIFI
jgi:hypothetical protein